MAANAAPTSLNETPIFEATGKTPPNAVANSSLFNLPSLTAAVKTSVAPLAVITSDPYAFMADVAKSATTETSPNPTALAFKDAFNTLIASSPFKPADVI